MWKSSYIGYRYAKYYMFHKTFPQEISFLLKIMVHNLPQSKNFRNSKKFPLTMSACPHRYPCLAPPIRPAKIYLIFSAKKVMQSYLKKLEFGIFGGKCKLCIGVKQNRIIPPNTDL